LLPYLLGQTIAFGTGHWRSQGIGWLGFLGILFVLTAVELFNEYFDFKDGGDRIFSAKQPDIPEWFFKLGIASLGAAFVIGIILSFLAGWLVILFCLVGFMGAYFYVGPPIRWAYRGFGEMVIGFCYGPFMVLGSYYIQAQKLSFIPFFASLIVGLSVFCLAILNEIPDYYQDMLVGKRNLVVRFGKAKAVVLLKLGLTVVFALLVIGISVGLLPLFSLAALVVLPWILRSVSCAEKNYEDPKAFLFAINTIVCSHVLIVFIMCIGFLKDLI
jgi:1,4-dihydroxy-2-naphthoate octaprenyltransferase